MPATTFDRLRSTIVEIMGIEEGTVTLDSTLNTLGADSLDEVELLMALEEEFDMELPDEEVERIGADASMTEWVEMIERLRAG